MPASGELIGGEDEQLNKQKASAKSAKALVATFPLEFHSVRS
jgi:hypothetical protein